MPKVPQGREFARSFGLFILSPFKLETILVVFLVVGQSLPNRCFRWVNVTKTDSRSCNGCAVTAGLSTNGRAFRRGAEIPTGMRENAIGTQVLKAAINVHRELRAGLLELKSVERISPAHKKQVQTYLRLTGLKLGSRWVNGLEE